MYEHVWLNGALVRADQARVSALSQGLLYGLGAFETMRWYRGRGVFRLGAHLTRLGAALDALCLARPQHWCELPDAIRETVAAHAPNDDVVVRLTITGGPPGDPPDTLIHLRDVSYASALYDQGAHAGLCTTPRELDVARHKLTSYASLSICRRSATDAGYDEIILTDVDGRLLEGTTTNLFIVRNGEVHTPPLCLPILPGITRAVLLELAPTVGVCVRETAVARKDLIGADEAFLTNSVAQILPLTRFLEQPIGAGRPGPVTAALRRVYVSLVSTELATIP